MPKKKGRNCTGGKLKRPYKVVGFLAREHGLNGLVNLIDSGIYNPICIFTHRLDVRSQYHNRSQRTDFGEYEAICKSQDIPLYTIDSKDEAMKVDDILAKHGEFDFIASISWRRLIPANQLSMSNFDGVNLHRGKLPEYAGAEPIKQALNNKDNFIFITSHILAEEIDSGDTIAVYKHPANYDNRCSLNENIERLKKELTPHFGPLLIESLNIIEGRCENG